MPRANGLAGYTSGAGARTDISAARPDGRRELVRALGRELRLWHERRASGSGDDREVVERVMPAGGQLAAVGAECGWRVRRIDSFVLRRVAQGPGGEHSLADGVGIDWIAGNAGARRSRGGARGCL